MLMQKGRGRRWGEGSFDGFKFGTFIGRFLSDSAASMAVKGLMSQVKVGREIKSEVGQQPF